MSDKSVRLQVLDAIKALIAAALPQADLFGLVGDAEIPAMVGPNGRAVIEAGDAQLTGTDLSPPLYWYDHSVPIELARYATIGMTAEEALDADLRAIGEAIEANRTLGGLCSWIEPTAPASEDIYVEGAAVPRGARFEIVATYSTTNPLR